MFIFLERKLSLKMNKIQSNNSDFFTRYQNQKKNKSYSKQKDRKEKNQRNHSAYKRNSSKNSKNNQNQNNTPKQSYFSYTLLEQINNKDLNEIIDFFYSKDKDKVIESFQNTRFKDDLIHLMISILKKIIEANSEPALQIISKRYIQYSIFYRNCDALY